MAEPYTQEEIDEVLATLIGTAGNASAAHRSLKERKKRAPIPTTITTWSRTTYWERYEELREKYVQKIEGRLTNDMLDVTRRAVEGVSIGTEKAIERLENGKDEDPGRTVAHLARAAASMSEKRMSLQGRPTTIHENRDATEILRSLVARGLLTAPDASASDEKQIEAGEHE